MRATRAFAPNPDSRTNCGSFCASHCFPSGSKGRSLEPTQYRREIFPAPSAVNSTERPRNHPPSLIRSSEFGAMLLTSASSSVNSNSPDHLISIRSPLCDHTWLPRLLPCDTTGAAGADGAAGAVGAAGADCAAGAAGCDGSEGSDVSEDGFDGSGGCGAFDGRE